MGTILIVMVLSAYWPATKCGFIWDDDAYIEYNRTLRSVEGLADIWFDIHATPQYYPLVHTSYWIEYHLWKLNPAGYHTVNILLHALSAVLLWTLLRRLNIPGAWLAAAVFAVHPVGVESVAWVTERKNVLSGVFYLGAALAYLRFALHEPQDMDRSSSKKWYVIALLLFIAALLGKTVTASLPGALGLVLWWKHKRLRWTDIRYLIPFFLVGAGMGLMTAWLEKTHVGAQGDDWSLTFIERFLVAGRALCFYFSKIVWPCPLIFFYPRWQVSQTTVWQYLFPIAVMVMMVALWGLRRRIGRGPLVAVLFFVGTLFPAIGFLDVYPMRYSYVADHFQYLACIGPITLLLTVGATLAKRKSHSLRPFMIVAVLFIPAALAILTWRQCHVYKDRETLWRDIIAQNPGGWMAWNNLGMEMHKQKKRDEAIEYFKKTTELKPDHFHAHNNLAALYRKQNKLDLALGHIRRAVELDPEYATAWYTYSSILDQQGQNELAIQYLQKAIELKPDFHTARYNLARQLSQKGLYDKALEQAQYLIDHQGREIEVLILMAEIYQTLHDYSKAISAYEKVINKTPSHGKALNNLAWLRATAPDASVRNPQQAVELAYQACQATQFKSPHLLDTLAAAYAAQGDFQQAILIAQKAVTDARSIRQDQLADTIEARLILYQQKIPYVQLTFK